MPMSWRTRRRALAVAREQEMAVTERYRRRPPHGHADRNLSAAMAAVAAGLVISACGAAAAINRFLTGR